MRRVLIALAAAAALGGCSIMQSAYDDQARDDCDNNASTASRGACYDRVDQNSRERRREWDE